MRQRRFSTFALVLFALPLAPPAGANEPAAAGTKVRGVVRSLRTATISSEFAARASRVLVAEGQAVEKGDVLIEFDCRRQQAEMEAAMADLREMNVTLEANTFLAKRQAASAQDVDIAEARAAKATATVAALKVQLEQCKTIAPFGGQIASIAIHEHELSAPGKPLATIVGNEEVEVGLIVPSNLLKQFMIGTTVPFTLDETGETRSVQIVRTAAMIDAISQTAMITAVFLDKKPGVIAGMSGTARLLQHEE